MGEYLSACWHTKNLNDLTFLATNRDGGPTIHDVSSTVPEDSRLDSVETSHDVTVRTIPRPVDKVDRTLCVSLYDLTT